MKKFNIFFVSITKMTLRHRKRKIILIFSVKSVLFNYIDFIHDCKHNILTNDMRHNIYSARHDKIAQHMNLNYKNMFKVHTISTLIC